jgi:hypothetical protein
MTCEHWREFVISENRGATLPMKRSAFRASAVMMERRLNSRLNILTAKLSKFRSEIAPMILPRNAKGAVNRRAFCLR